MILHSEKFYMQRSCLTKGTNATNFNDVGCKNGYKVWININWQTRSWVLRIKTIIKVARSWDYSKNDYIIVTVKKIVFSDCYIFHFFSILHLVLLSSQYNSLALPFCQNQAQTFNAGLFPPYFYSSRALYRNTLVLGQHSGSV